MTAEGCRACWHSASHNDKASALDAAFPSCACEPWSFVGDGFAGIDNNEVIARVVTTPGMYSEGELLTSKLTAIDSSGLSIIRQGASDEEILSTINQLVNEAAEPQTLHGAVVFRVADVREIGAPTRHFGIYHTPDADKVAHGDILATRPPGSNSAVKKEQRTRRYALRDFMLGQIVQESDAGRLLAALRLRGI